MREASSRLLAVLKDSGLTEEQIASGFKEIGDMTHDEAVIFFTGLARSSDAIEALKAENPDWNKDQAIGGEGPTGLLFPDGTPARDLNRGRANHRGIENLVHNRLTRP